VSEHKDSKICERTIAAAWGDASLYSDGARKEDTKMLSWCCHECLDTIRRHQFGYSIKEKRST
jgi:hypothetical protein